MSIFNSILQIKISSLKWIILFFSALCSLQTKACSCSFDGGFLETFNHSKKTTIIGQILEQSEEDIYLIHVKQVIRGKVNRDTIRLIGMVGSGCLEWFWLDKIGNTFLFNLSLLTGGNTVEYGVSSCGTNYLLVSNDKISGRIIGGSEQNQEMLLSEFLEILDKRHPKKTYALKDLSANCDMKINGRLQKIGYWKNIGYAKLVTEEGYYNNNGEKTGNWKTYWIVSRPKPNSSSFVHLSISRKEIEFKNGRLMNVIIYTDTAGNKLESGTILNGYGTLKEHYINGALYGNYIYKKGVIELAEEYRDGYLWKGKYKNEKRSGRWKVFQDNKIIAVVIYRNGFVIKEISKSA